MKYSTGNQPVHPKWRAGALAAWLDPFADWLKAKGYATQTISHKILLVSGFSRWLEQEAITFADLNPDHTAQYLRYRWQRLRPHKGDRVTLQQLMDLLQQKGGVWFEEKTAGPMTDAELCIQAYERYLRQVRGLASATITNYLPFVRSFLQHRFASGPVTLSCLCVGDVVRFVQHMAPGLSLKRANLMSAVLRSFLRYACHTGEVGAELAAAVPAAANWSMLNIPRGIGADQAEKLLTGIDRSCAMGRRDHAIVMLLARLGVRAGEIRLFELEDIDWVNGTLRMRTKSNRPRTYPMSQEVGEAIADYLRHGRPPCASRRVFVRARAPIEGFRASNSISSVIGRAIRRCGVSAPTFGTHQFRHGLATAMLHEGASLEEIGDVLGHSHPDTTRIYAKVDLEALRSLAPCWPGGVR